MTEVKPSATPAQPGMFATLVRFLATLGVAGWLTILSIYLPTVFDMYQKGYDSGWLVAAFAACPVALMLVSLGGIILARRGRVLPALLCACVSLIGLLLALFVTAAFTVT